MVPPENPVEPPEKNEESKKMSDPANTVRDGTNREGRSVARRGRAGTLVVMGVTAVVILAVAYLANRPTAKGGGFLKVTVGSGSGPAPEVGKTAPDFTATTTDGKKVTLSKFRGHPVWLTFGASWCQACRAEYPDIQTTYLKHRAQGLVVLAIFMQEGNDSAKSYATRVGLTFPKVADPNAQIASEYRIVGIPSHFFIDSTGKLRELKIGELDPQTMDAELLKIGVGGKP